MDSVLTVDAVLTVDPVLTVDSVLTVDPVLTVECADRGHCSPQVWGSQVHVSRVTLI